MTRTKFLAWARAAKVSPEVVRLLSSEADTIDQLVAAGRLTPSAGRRQMVRLAQRLGRGRP